MDKKEIGNRIREFLVTKFGKLSMGAEKLEISPQNLNKYLNGKFVPGGELISKLGEMGCDINWLLNIENANEANQVTEAANIYTVKDKIILSQTEEIFLLKKQLLDLTEKLDELEKESEGMLKEVIVEDVVKKLKKAKGDDGTKPAEIKEKDIN